MSEQNDEYERLAEPRRVVGWRLLGWSLMAVIGTIVTVRRALGLRRMTRS